jgi:peptide/histidine transporter 3/4
MLLVCRNPPIVRRIRWLDKAAIRDPRHEPKAAAAAASGWRLCTVSRVEEVKLVARVAPVWLATLAYGLVFAQTSTVYVSQVGTMAAPEIAGSGFRVPAASFQAFTAVSVLVLLPLYDRVLVPVMRSATGHERGISPLQRIGLGLFLSILSLVSAAVVDASRRRRPRSISAFWAVPQFVLIGVADVFTLVGQQEFFYDQVKIATTKRTHAHTLRTACRTRSMCGPRFAIV